MWYYTLGYNAMVGIVEGFRAVLVKVEAPNLAALGWSALVTLVTLALAWPFFRWASRYFADVIQ